MQELGKKNGFRAHIFPHKSHSQTRCLVEFIQEGVFRISWKNYTERYITISSFLTKNVSLIL